MAGSTPATLHHRTFLDAYTAVGLDAVFGIPWRSSAETVEPRSGTHMHHGAAGGSG
jgi:hypothetical protein